MNSLKYPPSMDSETTVFVDTTSSFYPDDREDFTIGEMRDNYDALCAHFARPFPAGVTAHDRLIGDVPLRHYSISDNPPARLVYIHGGGFVVGGLDSHDDICAGICADTGFDVIAVDYRLAPEHKHPAALDDCVAAVDAIHAEGDTPVVVAGDSAGGWLAAMTGLARPYIITGQVLIYPMLGGALNKGSYVDCADVPLLSTEQVAFYWETYFDCPLDRTALTPPMVLDVSPSPRTVMIAAECDPLMSDTPDYAEKLSAAGVEVEFTIEEGLPHGYLRARYSVERARQSFTRITDAVSRMAGVA